MAVLLQDTGPVVIVDGVDDGPTNVAVKAECVLDWICDFEDGPAISADDKDMVALTDVISVKEGGTLIWTGDFVDNTPISTDGSDMVDKVTPTASWHVEQHTKVR